MDTGDKLRDLQALHAAISSERKAQIRLVQSAGYRKRRLANCIKSIRSLRNALSNALQELLMIRGATNGAIMAKVEAYDARLAELDKAIIHQKQRFRIERLQKLMAQMNELSSQLPPSMLAEEHEEIDEEIILS